MNIIAITGPDLSNGLGCRISVWVSGCTHKCIGCQNKSTWDYKIGTNIANKENFYSIYNHIANELNKTYIDGITLTGGDPLDQSDENTSILINLIEKIKINFPNKTIWIYSGDIFENLIKNQTKYKLLQLCDVLVDGPFDCNKIKSNLAFKGSSNQRIIDLNKTFKNNKVCEMELS